MNAETAKEVSERLDAVYAALPNDAAREEFDALLCDLSGPEWQDTPNTARAEVRRRLRRRDER